MSANIVVVGGNLPQVLLDTYREDNITLFKEDRREVKKFKLCSPDLIILNMIDKVMCLDVLLSLNHDWRYRDIPVVIVADDVLLNKNEISDYSGSVEVVATKNTNLLMAEIDLFRCLSRIRNTAKHIYNNMGSVCSG